MDRLRHESCCHHIYCIRLACSIWSCHIFPVADLDASATMQYLSIPPFKCRRPPADQAGQRRGSQGEDLRQTATSVGHPIIDRPVPVASNVSRYVTYSIVFPFQPERVFCPSTAPLYLLLTRLRFYSQLFFRRLKKCCIQ